MKYLQIVKVTAILKRITIRSSKWSPYDKKLIEEPISPKMGVVIGKRTIYNGIAHDYGQEIPYFSAEDFITAYLVSFDMNTNPVYARADKCISTKCEHEYTIKANANKSYCCICGREIR